MGLTPQDFAEAETLYRLAAEQGLPQAQYELAAAQEPDLRARAEAGDVSAQYELGDMYWAGHGVSRNEAEAGVWYRQAAEQGQPQALWYLGDMYSEGLGVPQDFVEAHMWYNLATSRLTGDPLAASTERNHGRDDPRGHEV